MENKQIKKGNHVAVLGAGIIGINCALELQALGFQVTLIDKTGIGEGCSKANAGHFATEQVFPLAEVSLLWQLPKLLFDPLGPMALSPKYLPEALPWFFKFAINMFSTKRAKNTAALKTLNKHAIEYYKPLMRAANAEHLITPRGSLLVFENKSHADVTKVYQQYKRAGISVELLNRKQTLALEPKLSIRVNFALYFTDVAHSANPFEICKILAQQALTLGTEFIQQEISKVNDTKDGINLSHNNKHTSFSQTFDHLVIAAGAWSKPLLAQLGYKLPIEAERGYSLDLKNKTEPYLTRPVASAERKFIMTPMSHGLRLSGTVEFAGLAQSANMSRANSLHKNAQYLLNNLPQIKEDSSQMNRNHEDLENASHWLGFRPSLPDSLPVIGKAPNHKNIFLALGHQHLGLTLGAITGKLIGQVISNHKTDIDLTPFSLSRFN